MDPEQITSYIKYILTHINALFDFYNEISASFRFYDYQGRQRANDELANMLIDGGKKYNKARRKKTIEKEKKKEARQKKHEEKKKKKIAEIITKPKELWTCQSLTLSHAITLVVFGDGMKNKDTNKIKGLQSGVTGLLRKKLCQRQRQCKNVLVDINECLTSQICSSCQSRTLYTLVKTPSGNPNHAILECKTCGVVWNRDDNASVNMLDISNAIWHKLGRPFIFKKRESPQ